MGRIRICKMMGLIMEINKRKRSTLLVSICVSLSSTDDFWVNGSFYNFRIRTVTMDFLMEFTVGLYVGAQIGQTEEGSNSAVPRKQVQSEWKLILGESSVSIAVGRISKDLADGRVDTAQLSACCM